MSPRAFDRFMVDVEVGRNLKLARLPHAERWAFIAGVLPIAAKAPMRGSFMIGPLAAEAPDVARQADVPLAVASKMLTNIRALAMLERDEDGIEWVHDWEDWQREPTREKDAERARRYRERKKAERDARRNHHGPSRDASRDAGVMNHGAVTVEVEERSRSTSSLRSDGARERTNGTEDDKWPTRLPDNLQLVAEFVYQRLGELAGAKNVEPPNRRRVGEVIADFPDHDHRSVVGDVVDYWRDGAGARTMRKDFARVYRDRCTRVVAAPEQRVAPNGKRLEHQTAAAWMAKTRGHDGGDAA